MSKKKKKLIVSIDGGGIRGVLSILILRHLEDLLKKHKLGSSLGNSIDLIAGTSTGAIISAGLTIQRNNEYLYSPENLLTLYRMRGPKLFSGFTTIEENSQGLNTLLKRKFKNLKLSDLKVKYVFVSFDMSNNTPFIFTQDAKDLSDVPLSTALAACSAVPGLFPSVYIKGHELVDGFINIKNPAKKAYEYAQNYFPNEELMLLSIGTGRLEGMMFDEIEKKAVEVDEYLKEEALKNEQLSYYRFQPELYTANPQMDVATRENIAALIADGETYIQNNAPIFEDLIKHWRLA